jgi:pimeloyl-ACP methyl ester carboxylesterase
MISAVGRRAVWAAVLLFSGGCATAPAPLVHVGPDDPGAPIPGLVVCGARGAELQLDPARPLVIFVPGRADSGERYAALSYHFEVEGKQTACFAYDDRGSLEESASRLTQVLAALQRRLPPGRITIIGHSLGGLVARRALTTERARGLESGAFTYSLVTVATPFGGIRSVADCGRTWLHLLTLGVSAAVCGLVAGETWQETPPSSSFVRKPGTLIPAVTEAIAVVTLERGACRRRSLRGGCDESDAVFSLTEQRNLAVEADPRWSRVQITAGHVEIVGHPGTPPTKLIAILQDRGILAAPAPRPSGLQVARP